jgi:hypothetical protein
MSGSDYKHADIWNSSSDVVRGGFMGVPVFLFNLNQQGNGDT